jgi:hypothetical protein
MSQQVLTTEEAKNLVISYGPSWGRSAYIHEAIFPKSRKDVCVLKRTAAPGSTDIDIIYLVWKGMDGHIHHRQIAESQGELFCSKEPIHIDSVETEGDQITIRYRVGENCSWSSSCSL